MGKMSDINLEHKDFMREFVKLENTFYHDTDFVLSVVKDLDMESLINLLDCTVVALCYSKATYSSIKKRVDMIIEKNKEYLREKGD